MTKSDVIIDEGRDGWTLLAIKNGGKHRRRRWSIEEKEKRKSPSVGLPPSCVTPVGLEGQKKYAEKFSPLNTLQSEANVSP